MNQAKKTAIVIGAGVSGLAAAIRLRSMGYGVKIFDSNPFAGGKLAEIRQDGYRFDAGPSLFTMPHLVEELFWLSGKTAKSFPYEKLDEVCRYFFPDGPHFTAPADPDAFARAVAENLGEEPELIQKYLINSKLKYQTAGRLFLEKSLAKISTFIQPKAWRAYANIPKLGLTGNLHRHNERLFRNPKTVQLFDRYATYNGSDPYQTPAIMSMIPHLELGVGAFFPKGGMYRITETLESLGKEEGVEFHLGKRVEKIRLNAQNEAIGIECEGSFYASSIVVSAIDVSLTYSNLLNKPAAGQRFVNLPKSSSAIIFYWGIKNQFPQLGLHNVLFSQDYKAEFDAIFRQKTMPSEPTIYVNISSKHNPSDAPEGCENWFVMVNAPANIGQDWDTIIMQTRKIVLDRLSRELGKPLEFNIETQAILDPRSLETRTGAAGGALYGSNSNHRMAAFLRHANYRSAFPHLYFCGGTVHPGGGIPLALQSASIACRFVAEKEG